jgi:Cytochrome c7 and related cytochrome c
MSSRMTTYTLLVALLFSVLVLARRAGGVRLPGNQQGYEPLQPIAFSHRLHAGELQVDCLYCHAGAETSRHAGVPAASTCMNCHRFVSAPWGAVRAEDETAEKEKREPLRIVSPEIVKIYTAMGLNEEGQRDPDAATRPIEWIKVHNLPDFAHFDHRAHVQAGVACQTCHGPVETMERVRQFETLSMGWCVNCHREANVTGIQGKAVNASIDCATCHY